MSKQKWMDATGQPWLARITIDVAETLKTDGIDLLDPKAIGETFKDPFRVLAIIAEIHRPQWQSLNMTIGDFIERASETPEVADLAVAALEAALSDFFRRLRRPALAAVVERAAEASQAAEAATIAKVNDPRTRQAMDAAAARAIAELDAAIEAEISGQTSGQSPAS